MAADPNAIAAGPFYGTFLEHWPDAVTALSIPHIGVVLEDVDARALMAAGGHGRAEDARDLSDALLRWVARALTRFPEGVFLRLGGRSFVHEGRAPARIRSIEDALLLLRDPGYRASRMAWRCLLAGRPVWLFARAWIDLAPAEEIRLFFVDRALAGASQYHHQRILPELERDARDVARAVSAFAAELAAHLHLPDVVADVAISPRARGRPARLIELNPFMPITGGGLFDTCDRGAFDGTFRVRSADGSIARIALPHARQEL